MPPMLQILAFEIQSNIVIIGPTTTLYYQGMWVRGIRGDALSIHPPDCEALRN